MSITQEMIDCWRANYGLDKSSPEDAARWWHETAAGMAPAGAVAALGLLLQEREVMARDAARYRWLRANGEPDAGMNYRSDWTPTMYDAAIDAAMKDQP